MLQKKCNMFWPAVLLKNTHLLQNGVFRNLCQLYVLAQSQTHKCLFDFILLGGWYGHSLTNKDNLQSPIGNADYLTKLAEALDRQGLGHLWMLRDNSTKKPTKRATLFWQHK